MAKYIIDSDTLEGLGDAIRSVTGSTKKYTPEEMINEVKDILNATTFILVDKDGNEYPAVYVESDTVVTATANDIRKGTTAITSEGLIVGEKEIPNYKAVEGCATVKPGRAMDISPFSDMYQYTTLQAIVCKYDTSLDNSVSAEKVVIKDKLYNVSSTIALATVSVDSASQSIKLGVINESEETRLIRYMIIKEDT